MKTATFPAALARAAALPALLILSLLAPACAAGNLSLDVRPENRRLLLHGDGDSTIQIELFAPGGRTDREGHRGRMNLAVVIDRSGSMAEARKLDFAKAALHQLVERLAPGDVLSVVTYDDRVAVPWPASPVGERRGEIHRIVDGIYPGNTTCLSGGLEEGFRQARSARGGGRVSRVLLLSDGLANAGVTDRGSLRRRASAMAEQGVSVSAFGVGNDFDEEILASLADGGGGSYHYLADPERIASALDEEFRRSCRVAAADVEVLIRLRPGCRFRHVVGREAGRDGDCYSVRLGDLSAGERRTLFAGISVPGGRTGSLRVADVSFRYRDPSTERRVVSPWSPVSLEVTGDEGSWREGFDREVQGRKAVAESGAMVRDAARAAEEGRKDEARRLLGKAEAGLAAAPPSPAGAAALRDAQEYGRKLEALGDLAAPEAKAAQKEIKYRSYERLNRQ